MTRPCLSRTAAGCVRQPLPPTLASFDAWLRSRGYQPAGDPFVPLAAAGSVGAEAATGLVEDYLQDRPGERLNQAVLVAYAREIGDVFPVWGESVGFDVTLADWRDREVTAGRNGTEPCPHREAGADTTHRQAARHLEPALSPAPAWYAADPMGERPQP